MEQFGPLICIVTFLAIRIITTYFASIVSSPESLRSVYNRRLRGTPFIPYCCTVYYTAILLGKFNLILIWDNCLIVCS